MQILEGDTLFSWTVDQARMIASDLEAGKYSDSLVTQQDSSIRWLEQSVETKDSIIRWQEEQVSGYRQAHQAQLQVLAVCRSDLDAQRLTARKEKRKRLALGLVAILALLGNAFLLAS